MITEKQYWEITHCTSDFSIGSFNLQEVQEFLARKGYTIVIHRAEQNVEHKRSVPGTGEVESIGRFDTMVERILAVKPGSELPTKFTREYLDENGMYSVFRKELKKNLLA